MTNTAEKAYIQPILEATTNCQEKLTRSGLSVNCTGIKCEDCIIRKGLEALEWQRERQYMRENYGFG